MASTAERDAFFHVALQQLGKDTERALGYLGLTLEQFRALYEGTGEVRTVLVDGTRAGHVWIELRGRVLHIHGVVLLPEVRGKGIGTAAFGLLRDEFAGRIDWIELGVQIENRGALRFYERLGFRESGHDTAPGFRVLRWPVGPCATG
jgi:ribosomal protein S18 acetylase RimI-like enzyme